MTFRSQGSKALRAYNQYYIFHCHLHSYCKWLVSKIITGCIRNLGFAILLPVLGGPPFALPPFTQAPGVLMTLQQQILFTPQMTSFFFTFLPFYICYLLVVSIVRKCVKEKCSPPELISLVCRFQHEHRSILLLAGHERLD